MTADEVKQLLQLQPLAIEGGFFRETYRSRWNRLGGIFARGRSWFALHRYGDLLHDHAGNVSALHRLPGSEVFHFYLGDPAIMLQLLPDGSSQTVTLGSDLAGGQRPQVVVRGGIWQGCKLAPGGKFALMGTTMSPGFDYADYENGNCERIDRAVSRCGGS